MTKGHSGLDPAQVLEALRDEAPSQLSTQQEARLLSRVEASVVGLGAVATASSVSVSGSAPNSGLDAPISMTDHLSAQLAAHPISTLVTMLALGGALGAGTYASVTPRHHQAINAVTVADRAGTPSPAVAAPVADQNSIIAIGDLPRIAIAPQAATDKSLPNQRANATAGKQLAETAVPPIVPVEAPGLAEQLALLETARNAIRQRDAAGAMRALDSHRAQFPSSALAEEREALTIRALAIANRTSEAKSRLARFETAFPGSLLLPSLMKTLENYP